MQNNNTLNIEEVYSHLQMERKMKNRKTINETEIN